MQELLDQMVEKGLTKEQAITSLETIGRWLEKNYPVAGTLVTSWLNGSSLS